MLGRRAFLGSVGLLAVPVAGGVQPARKLHRVGFLGSTSREDVAPYFKAFEEGLRDLGYIEGRNLVVEHRYAHFNDDRYPTLATDLVRLPVDVVVAVSTAVTRALKQVTTTIPIVMVSVPDPVAAGLVASLSHPGGNVTGLTSEVSPDRLGKVLELLKEVAPRVTRVAVVSQAGVFAETPAGRANWRALEEAGRRLRFTLQAIDIRRPDDLPGAFDSLSQQGNGAAYVRGSALTVVRRQEMVALARKHRVAVVYDWRAFVDVGGLMSYGVNIFALFRRAAGYVDRILKGAKPAVLPIEQPTTFEVVVNIGAAKAIGLTIPPSLLARADQVIE